MKVKLKIISKFILTGVLTLFLVTFLSFLLMRLSPIDPAEAYARRNTVQPSEEQVEIIREEMGLNQPLLTQYVNWLSKALKLDFGNSLINSQPVINDLKYATGLTLKIIAISIVIQVFLIVLLGCGEYYLSGKKLKILLSIVSIALISVPPFYLAYLYTDIFAVKAGIMQVVNSQGFIRYFSPAIILALPAAAFHARLLGSILNKERKKDYVFYLQCRGLPDRKILFNHILPHGLIILIPTFMQNIGIIVASGGVIEKMFNVPGIGYMLIDHVLSRDAPMIHATLLFFAFVIVVTNIIGKIIQILLQEDNAVLEV